MLLAHRAVLTKQIGLLQLGQSMYHLFGMKCFNSIKTQVSITTMPKMILIMGESLNGMLFLRFDSG